MKSSCRIFALSSSIAILIAAPSFEPAHAEGGSQLSFDYGLSVPDMANTNPHDMWGVKGSTFWGSNFSIGGYYLLSRYQQGLSGQSFDYTLSGVEAAFHLPNGGGDTYLGIRGGLTKVHQIPGGVDVIYSPYHYGLVLGYDYVVGSVFTVGFEGTYLHVEAANTTVNNVEYDEAKFGLMNFLVSFGFRF